jgi:hypothetical protein
MEAFMKPNPSVLIGIFSVLFMFCILGPAFAQNARGVEVTAVQASSFLPDDKITNRYHPIMAFDNDPLTVWSEGATGPGIGETIEITFAEPITIDAIEIMPGYFDGGHWKSNNRVKRAIIFLDDQTMRAYFPDEMRPCIVNPVKAITITRFKLEITDIHQNYQNNPVKYDDNTCISEIRFYAQNKPIKINAGKIIDRIQKEPTFSKLFLPGEATDIIVANDGNYMLCGMTEGPYPIYNNAFLLKINPRGEILWMKTYGGKNSISAYCVQETRDHGFIICGVEGSIGWLLKTDAQGNALWSNTFDGIGPQEMRRVAEMPDGGFIMCGFTFSESRSAAGEADGWFIGTDAAGNKLWEDTFGGTEMDKMTSLQVTRDHGIIICGYTRSKDEKYIVGWLLKINGNGNRLWTKTYRATTDDTTRSVRETPDGGFIICGHTQPPAKEGDAWLIKTDAAGNELWSKTFSAEGTAATYDIIETRDAGFMACGTTWSLCGHEARPWLLKTDGQGNQLWTKTLDRTGANHAVSVQETRDHGFIICGIALNDETHRYYTVLIKTDEFGNVAQTEPVPEDK